jgi:BioD-like phosphotransacetylase family protein
MKVSQLAEKTGLNSLNQCKDRVIEGAYISDMVSDIITGAKANHLLVTLQTHKSLIAAANLVDVAAIVFTRGKKPAEDVVVLATKAGIALFGTDKDTWSFALKLGELGIK